MNKTPLHLKPALRRRREAAPFNKMTVAEKATKHIGESKGAADHDHDMIHELSKRLDAVWRYDQYISNAGDDEELKKLWCDFKVEEQESVTRLKAVIQRHVKEGCF
jgi:hypothetical protein